MTHQTFHREILMVGDPLTFDPKINCWEDTPEEMSARCGNIQSSVCREQRETSLENNMKPPKNASTRLNAA